MLQGARVKTVCGSIAGNARGEIAVCRLFPLPPPLHPLRYFYLYNIRGGRGTNEPVQSWMIGLLYGSNFYSAGNFEGEKV